MYVFPETIRSLIIPLYWIRKFTAAAIVDSPFSFKHRGELAKVVLLGLKIRNNNAEFYSAAKLGTELLFRSFMILRSRVAGLRITLWE